MPDHIREEVVSVAFLLLVRAAGVFEERDIPFQAYAWRCVRGRVIDARGREVARDKRLATGLDGWDVFAPEEEEESWLREAAESLPGRLAALLPREREAIERTYGLGGRRRESQREIAEDLGISWQAVCSLVQRATAKLRRWYGVDDARAKPRRNAG